MIFWKRTPPAPPARRGQPERSAQIDDSVFSQIQTDGPGVAVAVAEAGTVVHAAGYGLADVGSGAEIVPSTIFHLASCGKQFTALGILMLADERKLGLDDPIGTHIPELSGFGPRVTIRTLLHHTSSILDLYDDASVDALLAHSARPTNADLIQVYAELGCPMAQRRVGPGEAFNYSNSGYELLGSVIERTARQPYRDFFQARLFGPLGMHDTFSVPDRRAGGRRCAAGYVFDESGEELVEQNGNDLDSLLGSGSFYTTVLDLCVYDRALRAGSLVGEASMREALTSGRTNDGERTNYGFGWYLGTQDGLSFADHQGTWNGYYSYICRYLDRPVSIFVLSNNPGVDLLQVANAASDAFCSSGR